MKRDERPAMPLVDAMLDECRAIFGPQCKIVRASENGIEVGPPERLGVIPQLAEPSPPPPVNQGNPIQRKISHADFGALSKPLVGSGGFQSLCAKLRSQLDQHRLLTIYPEDAERLERYVNQYGHGGFQGRLWRLLHEDPQRELPLE